MHRRENSSETKALLGSRQEGEAAREDRLGNWVICHPMAQLMGFYPTPAELAGVQALRLQTPGSISILAPLPASFTVLETVTSPSLSPLSVGSVFKFRFKSTIFLKAWILLHACVWGLISLTRLQAPQGCVACLTDSWVCKSTQCRSSNWVLRGFVHPCLILGWVEQYF